MDAVPRQDGPRWPGHRKPVRFLATVMDITDRKKADEVLHWQARHDALTGLPNRYQLTEALQGLLGRESGKAAVMFVDIDRFKTVNDGIGHTAGDALLVLLGERLRAVEGGFIEFGVVLANEVGEDFGVGGGFEIMACFDEASFDAIVVFNHAVVDHGNAAGLVKMRMGIFVRGGAVGGPPRMA